MGYKTRKGIVAYESVSGTYITYGFIRDNDNFEDSNDLAFALKEEFPDISAEEIDTFATDIYDIQDHELVFIPNPDVYKYAKNQLKMLEWLLGELN